MEDKITGSVGLNGQNSKADVTTVQRMLIKAGYLPATNADGKSNADGDCGTKTINAIKDFQSKVVKLANPDGLISVGGKTWTALVAAQPKPADSSTADNAAVVAKIKQLFPNGVTVAIYCDYDKTGSASKDGNNAEFPRQANAYAKLYSAVAVEADGTLKIGAPMPIKSLEDITRLVNLLHATILKEANKANAAGGVAVSPAYARIKVLSLFSHGQPYGMSLAGANKYILNIKTAADITKFKDFVKGIRPALAQDVVAPLYACHCGREYDGTEPKEIWYFDDADKQDGSSSFAAALAAELGSQATVYGHLSAGHTVDNYSARGFGKEMGYDPTQHKGGRQIFYLLYPDSFRDSEATRLGKTREKVRGHMQKHYKALMKLSSEDNLQIPDPNGKLVQGRLGGLMFTDMPRAAKFLQADWLKWLANNPI